MAFGVLEPKDTSAHVPGTTLLDVHEQASADGSRVLKKGTGRNSHVVLVPQPSDDPNDPLNWPLWKRDMLFFMLLWGIVAVIGGFGPMFSPIAVPIVESFGITFTQFSLLGGYALLSTGAIGLFVAAGTRKYGKRPIWILSSIAAFVGCIWGAAAQSYGSFMGSRIIQGISEAFFESVTYAFIGDLYFVHERGTRTAAAVICYQALSSFPPLVGGVVTRDLGWRWCFWLLGIFLGIGTLLVIFFGFETAYKREAIDASNITNDEDVARVEELKGAASSHSEEMQMETIPCQSYMSKLKPVQGVYSQDSVLKLCLTPLGVLANPAAIWAIITLAFPVLWLVGIMLVIASIFSVPPYNLNPVELGYMWAGPLVVATFACFIAGPTSDWSAKYLSRRNNGKYEPEFRLFQVFGILICAALGYFLFGYLISVEGSVVGISIVWGLQLGAAQFSAVVVGSYVNDAYYNISVEIFIIIGIVKNILFYCFALFINDWVAYQGPANFMYTIGGIQCGLCFITIPLYMYGKRIRLWWSKLAFAKLLVAKE